MIPAEVWAGLAILFGGIWILVRIADSRRSRARVMVNADTVTAAHGLTQAYLGLLRAGKKGLRDASGLPRPKEEIGRALKTMLCYYRGHGEHGRTPELRDAYLDLAEFQSLTQGLGKAEAAIESERRRLLQDIEHFLAKARL